MRIVLMSVIFMMMSIVAPAQSWILHDVNSYGTNEVYDYELDRTNNKIYMNSKFGFCVFDLNTNQYDTCYAGNNLRFLNNNNKLIYANSRYWIVTSNGITSFDGNNFMDYNTTNGLLDNSITDIEKDTSDQLWLASLNGVSHFDGTTFIHDSGKVARQIAIDDSNRLYVFGRNPILIGGPIAFEQIEVKTASVWTTHTITGLAPFNAGGAGVYFNDIYNSNGEIIIRSSQFRNGYHKLTYPAKIDTVDVSLSLTITNNPFQDLKIDKNGRKWLISDGSAIKLFSSMDSTYYPHYIKLNAPTGSPLINRVKIYGNDILVYINGFFYKSTISNEPMRSYREEIEVNSIKTGVSVLGGLFNNSPNLSNGFEIPKGSGFHGIYAANIMMSSKHTTDTAFKMNHTSPFAENFYAGPYNTTNGVSGGYWILKLNQQDIQNHVANYNNSNYQMIDQIAHWPANGDTSIGMAAQLAPFEDLNQNGKYEPMQGEYPIIKGDEAIYWINHKGGFEYHGMLYGFDAPNDSALNQTLFLQYQIFNRSTHHYDSIKMGMFVDFDLGNSADDYMACDSLSNTFFVYNGDAFDEAVRGMNGAGVNIPFVGLTFLRDSMDGYLQYNLGTANNGDPNTEEDWHNYLNSKWRDGSHMTYGGDGFQTSSNIPTKYMYTNAGSMWSEDVTGFGLNPNPPGDRRGLGHIPYFSLQPGESKTIEMVVGYALEPNGGRLGSKDKLLNYLDSAGRFWASNVLVSVDEQKALQKQSTFKLYPNPAKDRLVIQSEIKNENVMFYSLTGRLLKTERLTQDRQIFDIADLPSGVYFIRIGNAVEKLVVN